MWASVAAVMNTHGTYYEIVNILFRMEKIKHQEHIHRSN